MNDTDTSPAESSQQDGFGILNLSPEFATRTYVVIATWLGIFVPFFFNMTMRGHIIWGKIGWKFSAYAHLVTWCPVAFVGIFALGLKTSTALYFWSGITRFSVFSLFLLYSMSIFYIFKFASTPDPLNLLTYDPLDPEGYGILAGIFFTLYTWISMFLQIAFLPAIDEHYW